MKKLIYPFSPLFILVFQLSVSMQVFSQNEKALQNELNATRTELLETKLLLLENKVLEMETESQIIMDQLSTLEPYYQHKLDSSLKLLNKKIYDFRKENYSEKKYTTAIQLDPYRILEGSLQLSYERLIKENSSIDVALMGTYVTTQGVGGGYLRNQDFVAYDESNDTYVDYQGKMFRGFGIIVQNKYYLGTSKWVRANPPIGFYVAPQLMYRKIWIDGYYYEYDEDWAPTEFEINQNLDVFAGGVILGGKFTLLDVYCIDIFAGGNFRLSKYGNEDHFTRYKSWSNIDYSGVVATAGLRIGILR